MIERKWTLEEIKTALKASTSYEWDWGDILECLNELPEKPALCQRTPCTELRMEVTKLEDELEDLKTAIKERE